MNALQNDVQNDESCLGKPADNTTEVSQAMGGLRLLSPQEIDAVGGGPEGEVGSGQSPPH